MVKVVYCEDIKNDPLLQIANGKADICIVKNVDASDLFSHLDDFTCYFFDILFNIKYTNNEHCGAKPSCIIGLAHINQDTHVSTIQGGDIMFVDIKYRYYLSRLNDTGEFQGLDESQIIKLITERQKCTEYVITRDMVGR